MRSRGIHGEEVTFNTNRFEDYRIEVSHGMTGEGGTLYFYGKGPRGKEYEFMGNLTTSELIELAEVFSETAERARKHREYQAKHAAEKSKVP